MKNYVDLGGCYLRNLQKSSPEIEVYTLSLHYIP